MGAVAVLLEEILSEAREIDSYSAHLRGRLRGLEEEVSSLHRCLDTIDTHSKGLKQKALSLHRSLTSQQVELPNLTVVK